MFQIFKDIKKYHYYKFGQNLMLQVFKDIKKYHYYYWFAFPAVNFPTEIFLVKKPKTIVEVFGDEKVSKLEATLKNVPQNAFIIRENESHEFEMINFATLGDLKTGNLQSEVRN